MFITHNKEVTIKYEVKNEEGIVVANTKESGPLSLIVGKGIYLPAIEEELIGHKVGSRIIKKLSPKEAFGFYKEKLLLDISLSRFQDDEELELGAYITVYADNWAKKAQICDLHNDLVTLDLNHKFASQSLTYDIEIMNVSEVKKNAKIQPESLDLFANKVPFDVIT